VKRGEKGKVKGKEGRRGGKEGFGPPKNFGVASPMYYQALILHKIRNAIPAWSGFLSVHLISQINGLLKRCYKYGYCLKINTLEDGIESANYKLFRSLQNQQHCLHSLLPPTKPLNHDLRPKKHNYQISNYSTELHKRSFIPHSTITDFSCIVIFSLHLLCMFFCSFYSVILLHRILTPCVYVCYMFIKRDRFFMKLFQTSNMEVIRHARCMFNFTLPSLLIKKRSSKFYTGT